MRRLKIFIINGFILTITSLIVRSISIFFNLYIANKVGSEAIGLFSLVMSVYMFAITVSTSGIGLSATKLVSEEIAKNNHKSALEVTRLCIIFSLIISIFTGFIVICSSKYISIHFLHNRISYKILYFIAAGLPFIAMSSSINGYFVARRQAFKNAISQILEFIVKFISTVFLLRSFIDKGLEYVCICLIAADVISEIFSFSFIFMLYLFDRNKFRNSRSFNKNYSKKIIRIAFPVAITSYIRSGLSTAKQLLIPLRLEKSGISCSQSISEYGIINGMVMPVIMFPSNFISSFSSLLVPEFSEFYAKRSYNRINSTINKIFTIVSIFSIIISSFCFIFADKISLFLYGNLDSYIYIKLLSPLIFFMYLDNVIDNILKGLDKQFAVMLCNIFDLFISIAFIYFLLPTMGIKGYIIIIFISEIFNFSVSLLQLKNFKKS